MHTCLYLRTLYAVCRRGTSHVGRNGVLSSLNPKFTSRGLLLWGPNGRVLSTTAISRSLNFSPWVAVHSAEQFLTSVHSLTGLPWWLVVVGSTVALRSVITLPLAIQQNKLIARIELLQPTIKEYKEAIKHNVVVKCRREGVQDLNEVNRRIYKQVQCKLDYTNSQLSKHLNYPSTCASVPRLSKLSIT